MFPLVLSILAVIARSFGMVSASDEHIKIHNQINAQLFKHITTYKIIGGDNPRIIGFHYYRVKPILLPSGYLSIVDKDLCVYSLSNPTEIHYGYIFYKGRLIEENKTFFPSSMNEEDLKEIIQGAIEHIKSALNTNFYMNSLQANVKVKISKKTKTISSIFPDLRNTNPKWFAEPDIVAWIKREQSDPNGLQNFLLKAAEQGNTEAVHHLLECGAKINPNKYGKDTVLIASVENNHITAAAFLIDYGATVNAQDSALRTALMYAASNGNADIVRLLLEHNADVNLQEGSFGNTALRDAVNNALVSRKLDTLQLLLDNGAAVNHQNNEGNTALLSVLGANVISYTPGCSFLKSLSCDGPVVIRLLLDYGADLAISNNRGESARDVAVRLGLGDEIIKLLATIRRKQPTQEGNRCVLQ